jgi:uncharacterized protein
MINSKSNILKQISIVRWKPTRDLAVVALSFVLVVGAVYTATNFIGQSVWGGMGYFLVYVVLGALLFGIGIPIYWMVIICKRPLSELGITKKHCGRSFALQLVFSILLVGPAYIKTPIPPFQQLLPLLLLSVSIGLFEAIFWRGWVQMRLEESFGVVPGIMIASLFYAIYHIGYGMPASEMVFLFFIGIMYAVTFRFTRNILILYPFFQPLGQLKTLITDQLSLPLIASVGFAEAFVGMLVLIWLAAKYQNKRRRRGATFSNPTTQSV